MSGLGGENYSGDPEGSGFPVRPRHAAEGGVNPKDLIGAKKVNMSLFPPAAKVHACLALMDGAKKYGPYNWREYKVQVMTYLSAIDRHLAAFTDGEDFDKDSGYHHLGHLIATAAVLIDAIECGSVVDNRPPSGAASELLKDMTSTS